MRNHVRPPVSLVVFMLAMTAYAASCVSPPVISSMGMPMGAAVTSELDFLTHMIPHHEEAIAAAGILRDHAEREILRNFARDIIATQSDEVRRMRSYLENWYPDDDHEVPYTPMMREMVGLRGEELERAFLEDMVAHHMAAVMMSQRLLARGLVQHPEVAVLARSIRDNQRAEIRWMMNWRSQWYPDSAWMGERRGGRMMMWNGAWGWFFPVMLIGLIAVIAVIVLIVWLVGKGFSGGPASATTSKTPRELLDIRYARGEVSREEYLQAKEDLKT